MRFTLLRVPVLVQPFFWIGAVLLGLSFFHGRVEPLLVWVPIVFFAVLIHEMGHALVGRRFGLEPEVQLLMLGGRTSWPAGRRLTPGPSILVSFAGPAIGLVLGGGVLLATPYLPVSGSPMIEWARISFVWTNLGWALFNLVPIVGLDGGNIMAAILEKVAGARGIRWAHLASVFVAAALATFFLSQQNFFMAFVLGMMAIENYQRWQLAAHWNDGLKAPQARPVVKSVPADERPLEPDIQKGYEALEGEDYPSVRRIAESLVPRIRSEAQRFDVAHLVAWGRLLTGDAPGAERALRQLMPLGRRPDALLEGALLLDLDQPAAALGPLVEALASRSDDFVATRVARAVAASKNAEPLLRILDRPQVGLEARPFQIVVAELMRDNLDDLAATLGESLFRRFQLATDAFNAACAHARSGRAEAALDWLDRAVGAGLPDPGVVLKDEDLRLVRERPEFEALRERVLSAQKPV